MAKRQFNSIFTKPVAVLPNQYICIALTSMLYLLFASQCMLFYIFRRDYFGLFGFHLAGNKRNIVLTGSEVDAMAVYQSTGIPAITLPRGVTTLPQEVSDKP